MAELLQLNWSNAHSVDRGCQSRGENCQIYDTPLFSRTTPRHSCARPSHIRRPLFSYTTPRSSVHDVHSSHAQHPTVLTHNTPPFSCMTLSYTVPCSSVHDARGSRARHPAVLIYNAHCSRAGHPPFSCPDGRRAAVLALAPAPVFILGIGSQDGR